MSDASSGKPQGLLDTIKAALGFGPRKASDASIQPSSNDTPPTAGGIDAAPHLGDDDTLMPVGTDQTGPVATPSTAGESPTEAPNRPESDATRPPASGSTTSDR